jgi:glycosyltransferase involved in cell wall biosynthesis
MARRVLHLLSQRPGRTGSGVTLQALTREGAAAGWEQAVAVGTPADDPRPTIDGVPDEHVHPLSFGAPPLDFALPGMSDVMPYASSRWRNLAPDQLAAYRQAWRAHLAPLLDAFRPDVIHAHHVWLLSALARDLAPRTPLVVHVHATGLRQLEICPHLAAEVRAGVSRADRLLVLTHEMGRRVRAALGVEEAHVDVVGAGYRAALFHAEGETRPAPGTILYAGKVSHAKGLPWLLDAFERLAGDDPSPTLHVAGSGAGAEADALRQRMQSMAPRVVLHGHVEQPELAALMRRCEVFVLPSFYEGLPLVVVEAIACGSRVVCTDLPTVREELAPRLGRALALVALPGLVGSDEPVPGDLPAFVDRLADALAAGVAPGGPRGSPPDLSAFTWQRVFERVERVWRAVLD